MKKHIFITALILALTSQTAISKELFESPADLENFYDNFYEAPLTPIPTVEVVDGSSVKPVKGTPLFKKTRIKVTNYLRERDYNRTLKLIEKEKQLLEEIEKPNKEDNKEVKVNFVDPVAEAVEKSAKTLELEGGVKEHVTANDVILDADNIDYDDKTFDITATGNPLLVFPPQNIKIKADKMIYNTASNILKAYGAVEVIRDGNSILGDYMQINMNEENAFLDNINTKQGFLTVTARKGEMDGDKLILHNGKLESKNSHKLNLHSRMIGGNMFHTMDIDEEDRSSITNEIGDVAINVKAKEVIVNAKKNHDTITLKKAKINYGDYTIFTIPSITAHTNKEHQYFEGNYPEFGSRGRLGLFAGPGFTFDTPLQNGSTVKLIPIINKKSGDFGFGGMMKYRSGTNYTELGYGSGADVFVLRGKQYFDDKLYMQYGSNSYMDEWFLGPRMAKYDAELIYHDNGKAYSTLGEGLDLTFKHRAGFGYMQNSDFNRHGESIPTSHMGTTRTRYMAEVAQSLFNYKGDGDLRSLDFSMVMQGSAALYGTGDTQFIGRIGPRLHSQYKYWMQDIGAFASAFHDHTPMQTYDMFRYCD